MEKAYACLNVAILGFFISFHLWKDYRTFKKYHYFTGKTENVSHPTELGALESVEFQSELKRQEWVLLIWL